MTDPEKHTPERQDTRDSDSMRIDRENPELAQELAEAVNRPEYLNYAKGEGTLTWDKLLAETGAADGHDPRLVEASRLKDVLQWPEVSSDIDTTAGMEPAYDLMGLYELDPVEFPQESLTPRQVGQLIHEGHKMPVSLNNFLRNFRATKPAIGEDGRLELPGETAKAPEDVAIMTPFLLRAEAVVPDLFGALRKAFPPRTLSDWYAEQKTADGKARPQQEVMARKLQRFEDNPDLAKALIMAYSIMGRLVRNDDNRIQRELLSDDYQAIRGDSEPPMITDAHRALVL